MTHAYECPRPVGEAHCYIDTRTGAQVVLEHRNLQPCPLPWLRRLWHTYRCGCQPGPGCFTPGSRNRP